MRFGAKTRSSLFAIPVVAVLVLLAGSGIAQDIVGSRHPISAADISKELSLVGVSVDASQVHLSVKMTAASNSPKLEVITAAPVDDHRVRLELRCFHTSECLPFFATLDVPDADAVSAAIRSTTSTATSAKHQTIAPTDTRPTRQPELRAGSRAVLIIRDGHLDIHLQVLAIDTGAIGHQVRVSTLDRKKVFYATVTGEQTVIGVME